MERRGGQRHVHLIDHLKQFSTEFDKKITDYGLEMWRKATENSRQEIEPLAYPNLLNTWAGIGKEDSGSNSINKI